ncbi:hypothetical protein Tco_1105344 [Tanacetum coccineum]
MGSLQMDDDDDDDDDEISNYVDLHMYMLGGGWKWQDLQGLLWWIIIEVLEIWCLRSGNGDGLVAIHGGEWWYHGEIKGCLDH